MPTLVPYLVESRGRLGEAAGEVLVSFEGAGGDHHVGALGGHPLGDAGADAPAGAGHQHAAALETIPHQINPFSVRKASVVSPM